MAAKWIEVFKTGKHTSGNGITKEYTEADLDAMVSLYNGQKEHVAPLVIGHPKTDDPAYGWTKELKRVGNKMLAYVDEVVDGIVDATRKGFYKKVSIAINPNGLLRHIGLLGAVPPAVKGLAPVQFAEDLTFDEYIWVTDETRMPIVARLFSSIRDFLIDKFDLETINKILNKDDIDYLNRPVEEKMITIKDDPAPEDSFSSPGGAKNNNLNTQEVEMKEEDVAKIIDEKFKTFSEGIVSKDDFMAFQTNFNSFMDSFQKQSLKTETDAKNAELEKSKTKFSEFVEGLARDGKVLPAEKDALVTEFAGLIEAEQTMTFAEGTTKPSILMKERLGKRESDLHPTQSTFCPEGQSKRYKCENSG